MPSTSAALPRVRARKSRWPARLDLLQSLSGLFLALFLVAHMFFVSSILISMEAFHTVARFFEGATVFDKPYPVIVSFVVAGVTSVFVLHAWLAQRAEASIRQARTDELGLPLLALERLTFRLVDAAFVLLSATLLAGWWFSEWLPQGWDWNHKTVFTLLSWLTLAVLLWGRRTQGWRGRMAFNMLYAAAALLLLGYVGSRFVLEVVLGRT